MLSYLFRLAQLYNGILLLDFSTDVSTTNVFGNTCPMLLHPLRKLTVTKILYIIAEKRAEKCSYGLISGILNNYFGGIEELDDNTAVQGHEDDLAMIPPPHDNGEEISESKREENKEEDGNLKKFLKAQNSVSSNTSVEIYR